jgi:hypothetical protein
LAAAAAVAVAVAVAVIVRFPRSSMSAADTVADEKIFMLPYIGP